VRSRINFPDASLSKLTRAITNRCVVCPTYQNCASGDSSRGRENCNERGIRTVGNGQWFDGGESKRILNLLSILCAGQVKVSSISGLFPVPICVKCCAFARPRFSRTSSGVAWLYIMEFRRSS